MPIRGTPHLSYTDKPPRGMRIYINGLIDGTGVAWAEPDSDGKFKVRTGGNTNGVDEARAQAEIDRLAPGHDGLWEALLKQASLPRKTPSTANGSASTNGSAPHGNPGEKPEAAPTVSTRATPGQARSPVTSPAAPPRSTTTAEGTVGLLVDRDEPADILEGLRQKTWLRIETAPLGRGRYIVEDRLELLRTTSEEAAAGLGRGPIGPRVVIVMETHERKLDPDGWTKAMDEGCRLAVTRGAAPLQARSRRGTIEMIAECARIAAALPPLTDGRASEGTGKGMPLPVALMARIPGISPALGEAIVRKFGSIRKIAQASQEDLEAVDGVGKRRAESIVAALQGSVR